MSGEVRLDETLPCDRCGRFGAYRFDGAQLCAECYEARGSCCPEFGRDDLSSVDDDPARAPEAPPPRPPARAVRPPGPE